MHDTYTSADVDPNQQRRSILILLDALAMCRPTKSDKSTFADLVTLRDLVINTGKQVPAIRKAAKEVLKKFGTGE